MDSFGNSFGKLEYSFGQLEDFFVQFEDSFGHREDSFGRFEDSFEQFEDSFEQFVASFLFSKIVVNEHIITGKRTFNKERKTTSDVDNSGIM